jgi:hypothetical protein
MLCADGKEPHVKKYYTVSRRRGISYINKKKKG